MARSRIGPPKGVLGLGLIGLLSLLVPSGLALGAGPASPQAQPEAPRHTGAAPRMPDDDLMKGRKRFEPGAHTAWHVHPGGQLILVEEGEGFVQRSGQPIRVLHPGDSDFTPAGLPHWHGAVPDSAVRMAMIHFGGIGPFLDTVSPDEYSRRFRNPKRRVTLRSGAQEWPIGSRPDDLNYIGASSNPASDDMAFARGHFEAGARTYWHIHANGQVILAEKGKVLIQRRGEPAIVLLPGQSDFTPAGVAHWHGAFPNADAQMVVVGLGGNVLWREEVSDHTFAAAARTGRARHN